MRIVFEVDDFETHVLKFMELAREKFLETHDPDAMPILKELLNLGKEIRVVRGQDDRPHTLMGDRLEGTLDTNVNNFHILGARQGQRTIAHRMQSLNEAHGQVTRTPVQEEQTTHVLVPELFSRLANTIPTGSLFRGGSAL